MKEFENINTSLPFKEDKAYVLSLVERSKSRAARSRRRNAVTLRWSLGIAAAITAAVVALSISFHSTKSPMDRFLSEISDEEASMIAYYQIEEIPEYY